MQSHDDAAGHADHRLALLHEMNALNFDLIRFASYRTAMKLRFIQKKVNLHCVDIWNVIEAFREHGLNTLEPSSELSVARLETLLCSLFHSLNKRVPSHEQVHVDTCSGLLLNWLLAAYGTIENVGKMRVFSIKIALATLCAGKLMDKLRYVFSQISDGNGLLIFRRFNEYLKEVLSLPAAVYESPTFCYNESLASTIFSMGAKVTVNDFMDTMMSDPGPSALVWFPLVHRIAAAENVTHNTSCDACQKESFTGFRYRCQKCPQYTLCQECFWRGRISGQHTLDHQVKEYATFSPSKTISQTLRKSFRCVPDKPKNNLPRFPEQPEKTLNLSHIVPPSPLPSHNGFMEGPFNFDMGSLDSRATARSLDSGRDDEHRLIARYAAKLKQETRMNMGRVPSEACLGMDSTRAQRELISQLEAKNKEIMREIARLRRQQELEASHGPENPALMSELRALRLRKDELENHLSTLQDSRRQLMVQLEGLMKMLKNHQASPRSTPNSSPRSTKSPPLPPGMGQVPAPAPTASQQQQQHQQQQQQQLLQQQQQQLQQQQQQRSAPQTPINQGSMQMQHQVIANPLLAGSDRLMQNDARMPFSDGMGNGNGNTSPGSAGRSLRNDLLVAADSVTNAMSTLVRELNSEPQDLVPTSSVVSCRKNVTDFEEDGDDEAEDNSWKLELRRRYEEEASFMAELRARHPASPPAQEAAAEFAGDAKSAAQEWEEAMKRWVNR